MEFNCLHVVIVTRKCFHEVALQYSDCDIRNYFPTTKKSVENEGIHDKSIAIVTLE